MGTKRVRFAIILGMSMTLVTTACGQVEEPAAGRVIVVAAAGTIAPTRLAKSSSRAVTADVESAESRRQEDYDLAATDRYPTLPPDRLELARDVLSGDGTDGV